MVSRQIEELKESYQEKLENTFEMYKDAIKEHAYQSAMNNLEDDYVPLDEFVAEEKKVEVCHLISCLRVRKITSFNGSEPLKLTFTPCQTQDRITNVMHCSNPNNCMKLLNCDWLKWLYSNLVLSSDF